MKRFVSVIGLKVAPENVVAWSYDINFIIMMQFCPMKGLEFAAVNMVAKEITADWKMLAMFLGLEYRRNR